MTQVMDALPPHGSRRVGTRRALIGIELFFALSAVGGAVYAFAGAPSVKREWLDGSPFDNYVVPGVILLVVVGGSLALAGTALTRRPTRWQLSSPPAPC